MKYPFSEKYNTPEILAKIMGPNPMRLEEELLTGHRIPAGSVVCDLGSGQGLTSVFLAREYGFTVYAADLWSDPEENRRFFWEMGLSDAEIIPVKVDAADMPFEKEFFGGVVSTDSYNYFGRDPDYLDEKLLPFVKKGGYPSPEKYSALIRSVRLPQNRNRLSSLSSWPNCWVTIAAKPSIPRCRSAYPHAT